jgi:hypothetical protein
MVSSIIQLTLKLGGCAYLAPNFGGRRLAELVIDQVHQTVGHMGTCITKNYAHRYFWWPDLEINVKTLLQIRLNMPSHENE